MTSSSCPSTTTACERQPRCDPNGRTVCSTPSPSAISHGSTSLSSATSSAAPGAVGGGAPLRGGVEIPVGHWYLGLRKEKGKFYLMVMSAKTLREKKIPSWTTSNLRARINAPLTHSKAEEKSEKLSISAKVNDPATAPARATFTLLWGNNKLSAPIIAKFATGNAEKKEKMKEKVKKVSR